MNTVVKRTSQRQNRQRITQLSRHEMAAADRGGNVPRLSCSVQESIAKRLTNEARACFDVPSVLREVEVQTGRIAIMAKSESARLSPAEIARQGRDTAAVIRELQSRLDHMHPELDAHVGLSLYRARGLILPPSEWLRSELLLIAAALDHAAVEVDKRPNKSGPAPTAKGLAVAELAEYLRTHSTPRLSKKAGEALARELIELATGS